MRRPHNRILVLLATSVLIGTLFPPLAFADSQPEFEVQQFDAQGDTVVFELSTVEGFTTLQNTKLEVTGTFADGENKQRVSALSGILLEAEDERCPNEDEVDNCFMDLFARTMEDIALSPSPEDNGDLRADTGPGLGVGAETGHDHDAFSSLTQTVNFEHQTFPLEDDDITWWSSYHVFVTIPGAERVSGEMRLLADGNVSITEWTVADAGFSYWLDDMQAAGAHTAAGNVYTGTDLLCGQGCGDVYVNPAEGQRLVGAIGPSMNGFYNVHSDATGNYCEDCFGQLPFLFAGVWGADTPHTLTTGPFAGVGAGQMPEAFITVPGFADHPDESNDDGPVRFFVSSYTAAGPQDLVAAGFVGSLNPAVSS